jgi:hypothetical protein
MKKYYLYKSIYFDPFINVYVSRWQLGQQGGDLEKTAEALVEAAFNRGEIRINMYICICL